jgi:hypothetical protein
MNTVTTSDFGRSARSLRLVAIAIAVVVPLLAWGLADMIGYRGQAAAGAISFIAVVAACSSDLTKVNWRTVFWGIALQVGMALFILKF